MAVAYTATIKGFNFGFDFEDKRIDIDATIDRLSVIDVYNAIKLAQASEVGIAYPEIATASGLDALSLDILTYITVKLLSSWEINTLKVTGKFEVLAGNLIRADNEDPFRDNPLITYINYISQAGVVASVSTGSGLSTEEHNRLFQVPTDPLREDRYKQLAWNQESIETDDDKITKLRINEEFDVDITRDNKGNPSMRIAEPA